MLAIAAVRCRQCSCRPQVPRRRRLIAWRIRLLVMVIPVALVRTIAAVLARSFERWSTPPAADEGQQQLEIAGAAERLTRQSYVFENIKTCPYPHVALPKGLASDLAIVAHAYLQL